MSPVTYDVDGRYRTAKKAYLKVPKAEEAELEAVEAAVGLQFLLMILETVSIYVDRTRDNSHYLRGLFNVLYT